MSVLNLLENLPIINPCPPKMFKNDCPRCFNFKFRIINSLSETAAAAVDAASFLCQQMN